jgi:hypothetical protein
LLERGLHGVTSRKGAPGPPSNGPIDVRSWEWERSQWLVPGATTSRFFTDDRYSDKETAFLAWPVVKQAKAAWRDGLNDLAWLKLNRIEAAFPRLCEKFPEFLRLRVKLARSKDEREVLGRCEGDLKRLAAHEKGFVGFLSVLRRYWHWGFPLRIRVWKWLSSVWERKHRIPGKLVKMMRPAPGRIGS